MATTNASLDNTSLYDVTTYPTLQVSDMATDEASDAIWILTSTFIIFTMQSGFGLLESGSVTSKNEVNIMVKNAVDVIFGGLTYWLFGYGLSFGTDPEWNNAFCGWGHFLITIPNATEVGQVYSKFFFQASFSTTATTIVSGGMAERTKLEAYILFSLVNTLVYCFPAHWVWDDHGWLYKMGVIDIAGAGAVHLVGGVTALVATVMLKPRHGRFNSKYPPPMGSPTNAVLGLFMLWWGWLGFNCGSTFGISGMKWQLAARAAVSTLTSSVGGGMVAIIVRSAITTFLASIAGGIVACIWSYITFARKFDIAMLINGVLGALVGITAFCALAQPWESFIIGAIGAIISLAANELLAMIKVDDPVGCVGVHCCAGIWSLLVVGLFAKEDDLIRSLEIPELKAAGLFYGGGFGLLAVQITAIVSIIVWTLCVSYILLKVIDLTIGLRVPLQQEILGADLVEHAVGDMEYCKKSNTVKRLRRTTQDSLKAVEEGPAESPTGFNGSRRQRRNTKYLNSMLDALVVIKSGQGSEDELSKAVAKVQEGTDNGASGNDPKLLWKFAVGKSMNKSSRDKRKKAKKNISFVLRKLSQSQDGARGPTMPGPSNGTVTTGEGLAEEGIYPDGNHIGNRGVEGRRVLGMVNGSFEYDNCHSGQKCASSRHPPECSRGTADGQAPSMLTQSVIRKDARDVSRLDIAPDDPPYLTVTYM